MSLDSADKSSQSSTPNSTSTYEYSHEPYETFQAKVLLLTQSLSNAGQVQLQRARGGSFNRVVIVLLTIESSTLAGIFRIPRFADIPDPGEEGMSSAIDATILDQAAVLQYLESKLIPAPSLIAYDASPNNAIDSPFILQEFSVGSALDLNYGSMSHQEKLTIVDVMTDFLARMENTRFSACGLLVAENASPATTTKASRLTGELKSLSSKVRGLSISTKIRPSDTTYSSQSIEELLRQLLSAHKIDDEAQGRDPNPVNAMWQGLCAMFEDMCSLGFCSSLKGVST